MENDKNKNQEPFRPEETPNPPQIVDPNRPHEQGERKEPVKSEGRQNTRGGTGQPAKEFEQPEKAQKEEGKKLLGESETEITDETTI